MQNIWHDAQCIVYLPCKITNNIPIYITDNENMRDLLQQVSVNDYIIFRQRVLDECCWTKQMYTDRRSGRTKITQLERKTIENIIKEINQKNHLTKKKRTSKKKQPCKES